MKSFFADFHIHIGRTLTNKPVKITGAKSLTIDNIVYTARKVKGLDLIGIIDCHVPEILQEFEDKLESGRCMELEDGGIHFDGLTVLLGSELEIYDENCHGPIHVLVFFPTISKMKSFSEWLTDRMTNVNLSSQRIYESAKSLQATVKQLDGLFIPAHVFTPFKSLYGKGVLTSLTEVFNPNQIDAIELGLSSNTEMADQIEELHTYTYLTNSDAHSLSKIAREYQQLRLQHSSFREFQLALLNEDDRRIQRNYGLDPKLGKYYRTTCKNCFQHKEKDEKVCTNCGNKKWTKGVYERLQQLKTSTAKQRRPQYIEQVPLEYFPGIGPKTLARLREAFQTEIHILKDVKYEDLIQVLPAKTAKLIVQAREMNLNIQSGGGGKYGKLL